MDLVITVAMVVDVPVSAAACFWHEHHQVLRQTQDNELAQFVGPVYPIPPHWPHSGTVTPVPGGVVVGLAVDVVVDGVVDVVGDDVVDIVVVVNVVAVLVVDVLVGEGLPPEPRYCATSSWKPGFLYSWLISHIITPPKLAKPWL